MDTSAAPPHLHNAPARVLVVYTAFLLLDVLLMEEYGLEGVEWDKLDDNWSDGDSDYLKGLDDIDWDEDWSEISDNCGGPDSICCVLQANRPSIETLKSTPGGELQVVSFLVLHFQQQVEEI